jgi:hypothetical protein
LTTFSTDLGEVALVPGQSGVFEVSLDGRRLFTRREAGRFPEPKEIKQAVRDVIAPGRSLGHSDVNRGEPGAGEPGAPEPGAGEAGAEDSQTAAGADPEGYCPV